MAGKLSLIDPVLSGNAAPLPGVIEWYSPLKSVLVRSRIFS